MAEDFKTEFTLDEKKFNEFLERIDAAPKPSAELVEMMKREPRWDRFLGSPGDIEMRKEDGDRGPKT